MSLWTPPTLWIRQGGHFYLRLFLLSRKAIIATIKLPKDISKAKIPMKIVMISYAVMGATSFPMYSGKPVLQIPGGYHSCHECFPIDYFNIRTYVFQCRFDCFYLLCDLLFLIPVPSISGISGACALAFSHVL